MKYTNILYKDCTGFLYSSYSKYREFVPDSWNDNVLGEVELVQVKHFAQHKEAMKDVIATNSYTASYNRNKDSNFKTRRQRHLILKASL